MTTGAVSPALDWRVAARTMVRSWKSLFASRKRHPRHEAAAADGIEFADKRTRLAWELGQAVLKITLAMPPESPHLKAVPITFSSKYATRGRYAIFFAGTVIGTSSDGVFLVSERSLKVLKELKIPFSVARLSRPQSVSGDGPLHAF